MARALVKVPHETINASNWSTRGNPFYSFEIGSAGKSSVDEAPIDVFTGKLISCVARESATVAPAEGL